MWIPRIKHRSFTLVASALPTDQSHWLRQSSREIWELVYNGAGTLLFPEVNTVTLPEDMNPGLRGRGEESQRLIRENFPSCVSWLKTTALQS